KRAQAELQRRWQYLAEAQRLSHSGTFGWKVSSGELVWSDETYRILGFARETNPTLDLVFDRIHPDDRERMQQLRDRAAQNGMDLNVEHRILLPDGTVKYLHAVAHAGRDSFGNLEYMGVVTDMTDRKRADEERQALSRKLEESNARLEESQRVAHLGYWIWNLDTNRVVFSNETCRIYGINQQEDPIDLEAIRELIHPEDRGYVFENAERSVRDKVPIETEHRLIRPSGEIRIVYSRGALTKDAAGRPYEMFGTCQDITERKLAEQALRRSQFYLSEGERLAHIGSWASSDLGISLSEDLGLYWSDEVYKIFGLAPEKGPPRLEQFLAAIHPQDRASMAEAIKTMHEQRCGCDVTKRIVRPDGEIRYVRCVGIPVVEDGVFQGFRGTTIDVTAQELLTQELRREQAYLAEAQSLAHIGSWASNLETGEVHHRSDETARLHGFDPKEGLIPLERYFDTLHPDDKADVRSAIEDAVREGVDYDIQGFRICRADDGQIRFLRTVGHRNPAGESGEYFGVTMDITELKRAEEERERLRQLEADIAHINRVNMMGELAAALAHEIKQPIAAAITSASACLRWLGHVPPDVERACAAAARIEQEGNRAADIINSLRSFYKTGTPAERQWVDVKGTVREMSALLRTEAARYSVTIRTEFEVDPPHILVDRVQLQQVLMNLMLNAIEAMKDIGGELTIRSHVNPKGHLTVSINDTGVGLPAEGADLIFDPFHTTKPQGTGMGLTITRSIVESYGGRVWATANQGAGATFHFTLPTGAEAHA
ncbi:MAG TPA: PAS domain-containing protein, partial [Terriglobales bacterium]|nr:PAS domain-containing protein [Terriglobales bacterium]